MAGLAGRPTSPPLLLVIQVASVVGLTVYIDLLQVRFMQLLISV
jgi:hypothetical protein